MQLNRKYSNVIQQAQAWIEYGTARQPAASIHIGERINRDRPFFTWCSIA